MMVTVMRLVVMLVIVTCREDGCHNHYRRDAAGRHDDYRRNDAGRHDDYRRNSPGHDDERRDNVMTMIIILR
jgi:hypothetical protein